MNHITLVCQCAFFSSSMPFVSYCPQEGSRRGQKVPQSIRSGAQGPVVHCLPLEKSLPALPWLKEREAAVWWKECARQRVGWMMNVWGKRLLSRRGYKSGPESHQEKQLFFYYVFCIYFQPTFVSFLKKCIFVPWSWKLKSAMVLTVGRLWPCDVLSLQYSPTLSKGYSPAPVAPLY